MGIVPLSGSNELTLNTATMLDILKAWVNDTAGDLVGQLDVTSLRERVQEGATVYVVELRPPFCPIVVK